MLPTEALKYQPHRLVLFLNVIFCYKPFRKINGFKGFKTGFVGKIFYANELK